VGIAPRGFPGTNLAPADAWVPYRWNPAPWERVAPALFVIGRNRADVTPARVAQLATSSFRRLANSDLAHISVALIDEEATQRQLGGGIATGLWLGLVTVLLAVAGALLLLRWIQPRREASIRAALGAGGQPLMVALAWDLAILVAAGFSLAGLIVLVGRPAIEVYPLSDPFRVGVTVQLLGFVAAGAAFGGVLVSLWPVLRIVDQPPGHDDPSGLVTLFGTQHAASPAIDAAPQLALMKSDGPASPGTPERGLSAQTRVLGALGGRS
jgi:hypothetical protein